MKYLFTFLLAILLPTSLIIANQIPIGYFSDKVTIWRYWEINADNKPEAKILVYNKTDAPITFYMIIRGSKNTMANAEIKLLQKYTNWKCDTVVRPVTIQPHEYGVYERDYATTKSSLGWYDILYVDNTRLGMAEIGKMLLQTTFEHRYYSYEGLQGFGYYLVGKDQLFSERGKKDKMTLYFDVNHNTPEIHKIRLIPAKNEGLKTLTMHAEDGTAYDAETSMPNLQGDYVDFDKGILLDLQSKDHFKIEVDYRVAQNDKEPEFDLRTYFNYGSSGEVMPILVK